MARNGSGTYSLPAGNPVVTNTTISSTDFNNTMTDIATALTDSVAKDGQTALTGSIDFAGNNADNVGTLIVQTEIHHDGDTNNKVAFGTDTQDFQTGGTSRLDISDSGVRMGAANARVTTVLDEDNMATNSATALATQQSIKAYADTAANPNSHATATITTSDLILFSDVDDSNDVKKGTAQTVIDLVPAMSDTTAGVVEAAVQSEMEAASSTTLAVTPGRLHYHPGVSKCWVTFNGTGTIAINTSYNTTGLTDHGTGDYSVTIDTDFSSGNYAVAVLARRDTSANKAQGNEIYSTSGNPGVGSVRIRTFDTAGNATDMEFVSVIMFGDQ